MPVVLAGFLTLFLELAMIRWMPANLFALAYFSNTVLIASFLGLGLGFLLAAKKRDLFTWFPVCLSIVVAVSFLFRFVYTFMPTAQDDLFWQMHYYNNWFRPINIRLDMWPTLAVTFVLCAAPFVLIGQKTALLMGHLKPLRAYGLNVLGSLLGVLAFSALSFAGNQWGNPVVWFAIAGSVGVFLLRPHKKAMVWGAACVVAMTVFLQVIPDKANWSPYYAINVLYDKTDNKLTVFVNRFLHQVALDLVSNDYSRDKYSLPYTLKQPKRVLVLGAGSGNDVEIALLHGAEYVRAVELDPVIAEIGRGFHPNQPYSDPRAHLTIGDARSFLRQTQEKFDLIVFATLDSHALLSGMSTVRVENFVYTAEAFAEAQKHLSPDGMAVIMYSAPQQWLADKIIKTAVTVFEDPKPLLYVGGDDFLFSLMILGGPGVGTISKDVYTTAGFKQIAGSAVETRAMPTDDWPYLYLLKPSIPSHYLKIIAILLLLSLAGVYTVSGKNVKQWGTWENLNFFCLGAAFLLLETKSVTSLSLLFGSTWLVNASVFGAILLMIFLANALVARVTFVRVWPLYAALGASLLLNFLLPTSAFLGLSVGVRFILPALLTALPLFFAALIFSFHAKSVTHTSAMLGVNLIGAVFGGFLEYTSMLTGLRFLYVVAGLLYLGSFLAFRASEGGSPKVSEITQRG